jgi:hypothetical protein
MSNVLEWLNENSLRAYPFKEDTSRSDGTHVIPNDLIVDMAFVVPVATTDTFYLKTLMISGTQITGVLANQNENNVGTFSVPVTSHKENDGYEIVGAGTYTDARGRVVVGDLTDLAIKLPEGVYNYEVEATAFELSAIRPDLRKLRGIKIEKADGSVSDLLTGIVTLVSGTNVTLENPSAGLVRINAIGNEDYIEDCGDCLNGFSIPDPIRTINGVGGDETGNLNLISTEQCLVITPDASNFAVNLADTCAQPCCGCTELEFLTTSLSTLRDSLSRLDNLSQELQGRQTEFFQNVLSSL